MTKNRLLNVVAAGIKARRMQQGMTIAELAEAVGIDTGYLAHIETAQRSSGHALSRELVVLLRNLRAP